MEQTDVARLLIMWHEGGFYQDVDRIYNVPMSHVLEPGVKMVLQTLYNGNFMQDQMCSVQSLCSTMCVLVGGCMWVAVNMHVCNLVYTAQDTSAMT